MKSLFYAVLLALIPFSASAQEWVHKPGVWVGPKANSGGELLIRKLDSWFGDASRNEYYGESISVRIDPIACSTRRLVVNSIAGEHSPNGELNEKRDLGDIPVTITPDREPNRSLQRSFAVFSTNRLVEKRPINSMQLIGPLDDELNSVLLSSVTVTFNFEGRYGTHPLTLRGYGQKLSELEDLCRRQ